MDKLKIKDKLKFSIGFNSSTIGIILLYLLFYRHKLNIKFYVFFGIVLIISIALLIFSVYTFIENNNNNNNNINDDKKIPEVVHKAIFYSSMSILIIIFLIVLYNLYNSNYISPININDVNLKKIEVNSNEVYETGNFGTKEYNLRKPKTMERENARKYPESNYRRMKLMRREKVLNQVKNVLEKGRHGTEV